jgi:hypothetical protein
MPAVPTFSSTNDVCLNGMLAVVKWAFPSLTYTSYGSGEPNNGFATRGAKVKALRCFSLHDEFIDRCGSHEQSLAAHGLAAEAIQTALGQSR